MDPSLTEATIAEMTRSCFEEARQSIQRLEGNDKTHMQTRLADLKLWADSVGATAQAKASLDWRFQHRPDDIYLIRGLLFMLRGLLSKCSTATDNKIDVTDIISNINSTVDSLAIVGVQIRRSGHQSRLRKADSSFGKNREKYLKFRVHLACVIASKPTEDGRPSNEGEEIHSVDYFANLKLTPIQERLVEANLRRRHRFVEAQRHSRGLKDASMKAFQPIIPTPAITETSPSHLNQGVNSTPARSITATTQERQTLPTHPRQNDPMTIVTSASGLDSKWGGLRAGHQPGSTATRITSITATAMYPQAHASLEQKLIKCPCCCQAIPASEGEGSQWRKHLAKDINPYTCILENCPTPYNLFATHNEWKDHFMDDHPSQWYCPCCQGDTPIFESLSRVINHIMSRHPDAISDSLEGLLSDAEIKVMGITKCPLCDSEGPPDSPDLVEHVLQHIHDFSLRSLPWPMDPVFGPSKPAATFDTDYAVGRYKDDEGNEYSLSIAEWAESMAPKQQDTGEIRIFDSEGNELFLDVTKYPKTMTPDGVPLLQLCNLDRNPPKIIEVESMTTQINMNYFSGNAYFKEESSDSWSSMRSRQPSRHTQNAGVPNKWTCTICCWESGQGDNNYFRHLEDTHHAEIEAAKQEVGIDIEEWKTSMLYIAYTNGIISVDHSLLFQAAREGNVDYVQRLLDRGVSPNIGGSGDYTPLRRAVQAGHQGVVQLLLDRGAEVDIRNSWDETPLFNAAKSNLQMTELLLDRGAEINAKNKSGDTPLFYVIYIEDAAAAAKAVELLLDRGAEITAKNNAGETALFETARNNRTQIIKLLLDRGAEVDAKAHNGKTPLFCVYDVEGAKVLLNRGAEMNTKDCNGQTVLFEAAKHSAPLTKLLLDRGAEINAKDNRNRTPLFIAIQSAEVMELLLNQGAEMNTKDCNGQTVLFEAVKHSAPLTKLLLDRGAEINAKDEIGQTPIFGIGNRPETIELLIDRGAKINIHDHYGQTPLWHASYNGNGDAVKVLLARGAKVNISDGEGRVPLHAALLGWQEFGQFDSEGHETTLELLLAAGAEPDILDKDGMTPLKLAIQLGLDGAVEILRGHTGGTPDVATNSEV